MDYTDYPNYTYYDDYTHYDVLRNSTDITPLYLFRDVFGWITLCIEFPVICWAIFALYHLVKNDNVAPVYVINLLISDILQLIGRPYALFHIENLPLLFTLGGIYMFGILASVVFMVCIALERYLVIVHPLWYRYRRTVRISVLISLAAWVSPFILALLGGIATYCSGRIESIYLTFFIFLILPFPLVVFFLVATWRALSRSTSVPVTERKRILCTLFLVLGNYSVLFCPFIVMSLIGSVSLKLYFPLHVSDIIAVTLLFLSPLMDAVLYIFMRKDANDTLKILPCCQRLIGHQEYRETPTCQTENETSV